jgi:alkanesulfonate monooxygenase SsuD/methylene tetrahydromethanopterin reductase-like flavin-dependent oxidoreductase (luciferase family)
VVPPVLDDPAGGYAAITRVAHEAERQGFHSLWLAEGHVATNGLPSALTLIAALAQSTASLRLGTAVITLAFENPLALAETASLVEVLSGGRLELGVGKANRGGWATSAFDAFQLAEAERDVLYAEALERFRHALGGVASGRPVAIHPPAPQLRGRLWQATSRAETARSAGLAGDGLQLHRKAAEGDTGAVQSALIDSYLEALPEGAPPRIAVSRVVLPAASRAEAVALYARYASTHPAYFPRSDASRGVEEHLIDSNIAFGTDDQIVETLGTDAAARRATDILFSIPLPFDAPEYREGLAALAGGIHPRLTTASYRAAVSA